MYHHPKSLIRSAHAALLPGQAIAVHAIDLQGEVPDWIHMVPAGTFSGRDGRGPYLNDQPDKVLEAFGAFGMDLPLDYEHQSLSAAEKVGPVPASGWGKELQSRDGHIWGRVEWTARAKEAIANKEVRYFSPVFIYEKKTGRIQALVGGGLTNNPNLYLQAVAHRLDSHTTATETHAMDLTERLIYLLNLPVTSTAEEIGQHLDRVKAKLASAAQSIGAQADAGLEALLEAMSAVGDARAQAAQALGLDSAAGLVTVLAAAQTLAADKAKVAQSMGLKPDAGLEALLTAAQAKGGGAADPANFVPRAEFDRVAQRLGELESAGKQKAIDEAVTAAMTAGKLAPASEPWARDYAARDLEGFRRFTETAPVVVAAHSHLPGGQPKNDETAEDELAAHIAGTVKTPA
ncbi:MAG: phage protease [Pseudomonadota bacterium]